MDIDNLVRMANSIGDYFKAYPDQDQAEISIAKHIEMFWPPRMRQTIAAHVREGSKARGLHPQVARAILRHLAR